MKNTIILLGVIVVTTILFIVGLGIYKFNFTNYDIYVVNDGRIDSKDVSYTVDGEIITLKNGYHEKVIVPGEASKEVVRYFGNDVKGDFNNDGVADIAFLLTKDSGGSGTFFYIAAKVSQGDKFIGTNAVLLGDRIAPQTTEFRNGMIIVNFAERQPDESFATAPSVGVSKYFKIINYQLIEVVKE